MHGMSRVGRDCTSDGSGYAPCECGDGGVVDVSSDVASDTDEDALADASDVGEDIPEDPTNDETEGDADVIDVADTDTDTDEQSDADADTLDDADSGTTPPEISAFRIVEMALRDPHMHTFALGVVCDDVTEETIVGEPGVNEVLFGGLNTEVEGQYAQSVVLLLEDFAFGTTRTANGTVIGAICEPAASCTSDPEASGLTMEFTQRTIGDCLVPAETELSSVDYQPVPPTVSAPCIVGTAAEWRVPTSDFEIPLVDVEIAATFASGRELNPGLIRGFLRRADAEAVVPSSAFRQAFGGGTLEDLLAGTIGNCAQHNDTDGDGWWFYIAFQAETVALGE